VIFVSHLSLPWIHEYWIIPYSLSVASEMIYIHNIAVWINIGTWVSVLFIALCSIADRPKKRAKRKPTKFEVAMQDFLEKKLRKALIQAIHFKSSSWLWKLTGLSLRKKKESESDNTRWGWCICLATWLNRVHIHHSRVTIHQCILISPVPIARQALTCTCCMAKVIG
jgi:hypothetical protein